MDIRKVHILLCDNSGEIRIVGVYRTRTGAKSHLKAIVNECSGHHQGGKPTTINDLLESGYAIEEWKIKEKFKF